MRRLRERIKLTYSNASIKRKFVLILLYGAVIPILLVQLLNYALTTYLMRDHLSTLRSASLDQIHNDLLLSLDEYYQFLIDLNDNSQVSRNAVRISVWDKNYQIAQRTLRSELKEHVDKLDGVMGIALIAANRDYVFYDKTSLSSLNSYCFNFPTILETALVKYPYMNPLNYVTATDHIDTGIYGEKQVMYLSYSISDLENLERSSIATVVLCIDEQAIRSRYIPIQEDADNSAVMWLMNRQGEIISSTEPDLIGSSLGEPSDGVDIEKRIRQFLNTRDDILSSHLELQISGDESSKFVLVRLEDDSIVVRQIYQQGAWILLTGLVLIYVVAGSIRYTSNKIDRDVKSIVDAMEQANEGYLDVRIVYDGQDEFAQISGRFNVMIHEMKQLIEQEKLAQDRRREAEVQALEAQINPHFLYNTLDSINWVAIEQDDLQVSKMLMYLAQILRYSVDKSTEVVPLAEELAYLRKYIVLQQHRYKYSFACIMDVNEDLLDTRIRKMLIQPLLENCIEHAFPGPSTDDLITVRVERGPDDLIHISVSDNGIGMSEENIAFLNMHGADDEDRVPGIGLRNVFRRIKIYYGDSGSYNICLNEQGGCTVKITLAYERYEDEVAT